MTEGRYKVITALLSFTAVLVIGTLGLSYLEGWSLFDSLWFTLISLTTTGYGDMIPHTVAGRVFVLVILAVGIGLFFYTAGVVINMLVERQFMQLMDKNHVQKKIDLLKDHIIVCGAGRVGGHVASILKAEKTSYVLVDHDAEVVSQRESEGELIILGDATQDEVLYVLGLMRARGVVCALAEDAYNLYVTLTARSANPDLKIVARAERTETVDKLKKAGANKVITPTLIAGTQMAMAMLKPLAVDLIDTLYTPHRKEVVLEEYSVDAGSPLIDQEVKDVFVNIPQVTIVAIIRNDEFITQVRGSQSLLVHDTLVLLGAKKDLEQFESLIGR